MDKTQIKLAKVIEKYFGADAGYLDISCLDLARWILDAGYEKPVRCKDCKHCRNSIYPFIDHTLRECKVWKSATREDDFCSYGERRC